MCLWITVFSLKQVEERSRVLSILFLQLDALAERRRVEILRINYSDDVVEEAEEQK